MKRWSWLIGALICAVIIVAGFFCAIDNIGYLLASSNTFGKYKYTSNDYASFLKQDLVGVALNDEDNDNYYTYVKVLDRKDFNGLYSDYELVVNNLPCYSTTVNAGSIISVFKTDLKDVNNEITATININITVEFLASGTKITVGLNNANNQLFVFEEWISNNGFTVEVLEVNYE